jgi:hypothetical protein
MEGTMERRQLIEDGQASRVNPTELEKQARSAFGEEQHIYQLQALDRCLAQAHAEFNANRFEEALRKYEEAVLCGADIDSCAHERWTCLMKLGRYELAWRETDRTEAQRRAECRDQEQNAPHERRVWSGAPLYNKHVLVRCYHGLGDTIQFARYIPMLRAQAKRVLLQAQDNLQVLLGSMGDLARFVDGGEQVSREEFDVEVELMELPYIFRTQVDSIPAEVPYLRVPRAKRLSKREELSRLGLQDVQLNVGLVWSSGDWNPARNINLIELKSLGAIAGVNFFGLQRGVAAQQIEQRRDALRVISTEAESGVLLDTAATIANLDLIISVDTMVAHLAGALGKPVWTLLPFCSDWRWMADREDTLWYPTMRLFRQPRRNDWTPVVERLAAELNKLAITRHQASCGCS